MSFNLFIDRILKAEGGYSDHPADKGGPTNFGITQAVARANGYRGEMAHLPESLAREIYKKRYVVRPGFDRVAVVHSGLAYELVDTGVNMGPAVAATFLQRWLNGFNQQGSRYADVFVDGNIGEVTIAALRAFLAWRGEEGARVLIAAVNCTQGSRYLDIAEANSAQEAFLYGWVKNRVLEGAH